MAPPLPPSPSVLRASSHERSDQIRSDQIRSDEYTYYYYYYEYDYYYYYYYYFYEYDYYYYEYDYYYYYYYEYYEYDDDYYYEYDYYYNSTTTSSCHPEDRRQLSTRSPRLTPLLSSPSTHLSSILFLSSPIHLPKDNVLRSDNGHHVRQHVSFRHEVQPLEVIVARGSDLALVGTRGPVAHHVDAKFTLRRLHRAIRLPGRNRKTCGCVGVWVCG